MMAIVIFIDTTEKSDGLISKFKSEGHTVEKVSWVEEVKKKNSFKNKVLFWHISSSKIVIDSEACNVSLKNIKEAINILNNCQFNYKFGVTDNDEQYKQEVRKAWNFDDVESWDALKDRFKEGLEKGIESQDKIIKTVKNYLLHLFLPLDIDMQALKILWNGNKEKKAVEYLKEMLSEVEDGFFQNKFNEAKKLIEDMPVGDNKNALKDFLRIDEGENSYICKFFMLLDTKKKECAGLTEQNIQDVISYFSNSEHKTFHDWYCELTKSGVQKNI